MAMGGLGDLLLREMSWGVNFLLWVAAMVGVARVLAWRDAPTLVFLNVLAVVVSLSLGRSGGSLRLRGVSGYVLGGIFARLSP